MPKTRGHATRRFWAPEHECAPIPDMVARMERRLAETDLFSRAARSPLYHERWQSAGIEPASVRSYADLQRVPYTNAADLRAAQSTHHPDEFVCSADPPRVWVSTSGSTGVPKWIPIGAEDLELARKVGHRLTFFAKEPGRREDVALAVTAPAPFISDMSLWPGLINELRGDGPQDVESGDTIVFSFEDGVDGVAMALKRRMTVIVAFPSLIMRIAEGLAESAPPLARSAFREKPGLVTLLAFLITRVRKIRPRDVVRVHTGVFAGEPLDPYRKPLYDAWGLKLSYNLYTFSEYQVALTECSAQNGIHVWMDVSFPEIILQADLEREREEEGYVPPARPLWQAGAGDEGELVLTHFGDAFPLVRWRTSDLIHVISTGPCSCGRTLPRVNFLQRSDDLVNLGVIRVSTFELKKSLDSISKPASVAGWQLRVARSGYKPLLKVLVRPQSPVDEAQMVGAVRAALEEVEHLRLGVENRLICEPMIQIVADLEDRLSTSGKFRPLVYESEAQDAGVAR
jgi:phenylacetate-CoA ligase